MAEIKTDGDLTYLDYVTIDENTKMHYLNRTYVYLGDGKIWLVRFVTMQETFPLFVEDIEAWAASVTIENA